jgi:WD40 repeat protein
MIAAATPTVRHIFLFDRATGRQTGQIGPLAKGVGKLAFSHDGRTIAAGIGGARSDEWSLRLFELAGLKEIAFDDRYTGSIHGISFDTTGRIATTSNDGKLRLYNPDLKLIRAAPAPGSPERRPYQILFSPDDRRLAVGYTATLDRNSPRVDIVDGETLEPMFAPSTAGYTGRLSRIAWSADGGILYAGGSVRQAQRTAVLAWQNGGHGSLQVFPAASNAISDIREIPGGRIVVGSTDPRLSLLDPTGAALWQIDSPGADFRNQNTTLKVSPDGKQVLFGFELGGKSSAMFDISKRVLDVAPAPGPELTVAQTQGLIITNWKNHERPQIKGQPLEMKLFEVSRSLAIARDNRSFWLGTEWYLRHFDVNGGLIRQIEVAGIAWAVNLAADDRLIIAAHSDGTIRWYRSEDGAELLAFYPHADRKQWVAWTPLGHYAASPGGEDLIQWQINRGLDREPVTYSASRFRDQFYRPDVIERVLDVFDPRKALDAADDAAGLGRSGLKSIAEYTPPRVAIIDPADLTFVDKPELAVAYTIEDRPGAIIRRIRLLLDGHVVAEEGNRKLLPADGRMTGEFKIVPQGEQLVLTLLAENEHGSSDPFSIRLRRNASVETHKPALYVLAIGVGQFKNHPRLKLDFAHADATEFVARVRKQEHGLYGRVLVRSLVNEEATQQGILDGLEWIERSMSARDVAVLFFSTHGENDANGELYMLPHDVDLGDDIRLRRTGVRYSDLRATLIRLADRGKTLIFLDACRSGNVRPGTKAGLLDVDKVAADLASAENGVVVFSSSTGKQFSMEIPELRHGAFTAALLEAFDGKSDLHEPPWVRVTDLEMWLSDRVKKLTNGAQTPRTTIPGERLTNPRVFMIQQ